MPAAAAVVALNSGADAPAAGSKDIQQRLSQLEALVLELQKQQVARAAQGPAASALHDSPTAGVHGRGQQAPSTGSGDVQHQQQGTGGQHEQQGTGQPAVEHLKSAWHWVSSRVLPRQPTGSADVDVDAADGTISSGSSKDSRSSSMGAATAPPGSRPVPAEQSAARQAAGAAMPAIAEQGTATATAAAASATPPGNAANKLLHALGHPMRWLRRKSNESAPPTAGT